MARHGAVILLVLVGAFVPLPAAAQSTGTEGLAHPRRVRSFIGAFDEGRTPIETQLVQMGLRGSLFLTGGRTRGGTQYRVELDAGVAAEFDMAVSSFDFIAADFLVGVPLALWRGPLEMGLRVYHQSSHLGDDFLTRRDVGLDSLNAYDFEAVDVFVGRARGRLQPYAGFEYRFRRTPDWQDPSIVHLGAAFHGRGRTRLVGGIHGWWAENGDDELGVQARLGVEIRRRGTGQGESRPVRILLEGSWGPPDAGRFFRSSRRTLGVTVEVARR